MALPRPPTSKAENLKTRKDDAKSQYGTVGVSVHPRHSHHAYYNLLNIANQESVVSWYLFRHFVTTIAFVSTKV
jgi:hypothetical protein